MTVMSSRCCSRKLRCALWPRLLLPSHSGRAFDRRDALCRSVAHLVRDTRDAILSRTGLFVGRAGEASTLRTAAAGVWVGPRTSLRAWPHFVLYEVGRLRRVRAEQQQLYAVRDPRYVKDWSRGPRPQTVECTRVHAASHRWRARARTIVAEE